MTDPKDCVSDGTDNRSYGELSGLSAAKRLFANILGCKPEECFIGGNASLTLMYDTDVYKRQVSSSFEIQPVFLNSSSLFCHTLWLLKLEDPKELVWRAIQGRGAQYYWR